MAENQDARGFLEAFTSEAALGEGGYLVQIGLSPLVAASATALVSAHAATHAELSINE
ncbi:MAG: hypothetical protein AAF224_13995 [Pseudomonadota bacterium]